MLARSPEESFRPTNTPGKASRSRAITEIGIGTAENIGI